MNKVHRNRPWMIGGVALALALSGPAIGQTEQPSLDELLGLEEQPRQTEREAGEQERPAEGLELEESVKRLLSGEEAADEFEQAVQEMDEVSLRLGRSYDGGLETQRMQERILARLDQVIETARRQQQQSAGSSSGGGGTSDSQPQQQDTGSRQQARQQGRQQPGGSQAQASASGQAASGDASVGEVAEARPGEGPMRELLREWGSLPPRLRQEISEGLEEPFSGLYRSLTQEYYQRLAEEQEDRP